MLIVLSVAVVMKWNMTTLMMVIFKLPLAEAVVQNLK